MSGAVQTLECDEEQQALRVELQADVAAATVMRQQLDHFFTERVCDKTAHEMKLLVTELISNSVRHSGCDVVRVVIRLFDTSVRVCVKDDGPGFEPEFRCDTVNGGGFGLFLVDQLARRWGVNRNGSTNVWFEMCRYQNAV